MTSQTGSHGCRSAHRAAIRRPRWAAALVVLSMAGVLAACGVRGEKLLERAELAIDEGRYRAAYIDLQNYLSKSPDDARARARLAYVLTELNDYDRADTELKKARDLGAARELTIVPECRILANQREFASVLGNCSLAGAPPELDGTLTAIRGSAQFGLEQYPEARRSFERALELNPNDVNALLGAAQAAIKAGDGTAARQLFENAPASLRQQSAYWRALGYIEVGSNRPQDAEKAYTTALGLLDEKVDSDEILDVLAALTQLQIRLGKYAEAEATAQRMLKLAPDAPGVKYYAGLAAESLGDLERARTYYEAAAVLDWVAPKLALARLNLRIGNYNQAESGLKQVLAKEPDNRMALDLLAQVRGRLQSPEQTLSQMEPQLERSPDDVDLAIRATRLNMEIGNEPAAREYLRRAEAAAKTPEERMKVAGGYIGIGDFDRALALLEAIPEQGEATKVRKDLLTAVALLKKGDRKAAAELASAMVSGTPDPEIRSVAGGIFAQAGDYARAREQFTKVLAAKPEDTATRFRLADVELRAGDFAAATAQLQGVLDRDASNELAARQMARVALLRGDPKEMERWVRKARDEHPKSVSAQLAFAQAMLATRQLDEARSAAEAAVSHAPNEPKALTMLAAVQSEQGDLAASTATLRKVVDKFPGVVGHRLNLARALYRQGKGEQSLQTIDQALTIEPRNAQVLGNGVMLALASGDVERAAGYAARFSQLDPTSPVALRLEARVAVAQKRYRDAVALFDRAAVKGLDGTLVGERFEAARRAKLPDADKQLLSWLDAHPDDVKLRMLFADRLSVDGDIAGARKQYEIVLERTPRSVVAQNNLAVIYQQQGDPRAASLAKSAYESASASPMVADTYGWILVEQGEVGQGVEILRKAAANPAATPEVRYHLAEGLSKQGNRDEALKVLRSISGKRGAGYEAVRADVERLIAEIEK